ncbi:hypothetical protein Dsin_002205 [Dipteronia sinensis]|uniref:Uncharacterized protein n=1 Tax=Dipteronia sinensis TaxID=43782 RepID=A0AAE0B6S0_9ROSI|nr:hypothetical protein Dsin_002205 [Dipteronia sinensis]
MDNYSQAKVQKIEEFVDRHLKPDLENRMGEDVDLLVKVSEHFPAKINSTSSMVTIKHMKEKLTEVQLALFRITCFGRLLEMHELKFSGQLVHHLLLRQIQSHNNSEMWFAVGGKNFFFFYSRIVSSRV